jgi:hypothetical protein
MKDTDRAFPPKSHQTALNDARVDFQALKKAFGSSAIPVPPTAAAMSRSKSSIRRESRAANRIVLATCYGISTCMAISGANSALSNINDLAMIALVNDFAMIALGGGTIFFLYAWILLIAPFRWVRFGVAEPDSLVADIEPEEAKELLALCLRHPPLEQYRQDCIAMGRSLAGAEASGFKLYDRRIAELRAAEIAMDDLLQAKQAVRALNSSTHAALAPVEAANLDAREAIAVFREPSMLPSRVPAPPFS